MEFRGDQPPDGDRLPTLNRLSLAKLAFLSPFGLTTSYEADTALPLLLVATLFLFALSPLCRLGIAGNAVVLPLLRSRALLIFSIDIASVSESELELIPMSVREKISSAFMRSNSSSESVLDVEDGTIELAKTDRTICGSLAA